MEEYISSILLKTEFIWKPQIENQIKTTFKYSVRLK